MERKKYIDNIRWITVALVVVYHVIFIFNGTGTLGGVGPLCPVQYQDAVLYLLYPWFMLLLFVVSGMCARFYLGCHTHKEFIRERTVKLLVPSTLGVVVFGWILGYFNMKIGGAFDSMGAVPKPVLFVIMCLSGTGPLWYIQLLWVFSLLLTVFRRVEKDRLSNLCAHTTLPVLLALTVVIYGAAQIGNVPVVVVYRFGIYGAGYLLGYLVFAHDEVMTRLEKAWLPLTAAALILGAAFTAVFWGQSYAGHEVLDTPLCNVFAWIAVLAVLAFMKKWGGFDNAFARWMTRKSWGLYLFHYLPLAACAYYIYAMPIPAVLKYLLTAASAVAGGVLLYDIISRIPVLRWCVCGISRKK